MNFPPNVFDSSVYSRYQSVHANVCDGRSELILTFKGIRAEDPTKQLEGDGVVTISLVEGMPMIRVEVDLDGIPFHEQASQEVTVNFYADINNNGVFWTDSNGLEMQRRELNKRPSWDWYIP